MEPRSPNSDDIQQPRPKRPRTQPPHEAPALLAATLLGVLGPGSPPIDGNWSKGPSTNTNIHVRFTDDPEQAEKYNHQKNDERPVPVNIRGVITHMTRFYDGDFHAVTWDNGDKADYRVQDFASGLVRVENVAQLRQRCATLKRG